MTPVWITLALIVAMVAIAAVRGFPIWNPVYFFGALFALQIGAGFVFLRRLGSEVPPAFSLPLLGAYLVCLGLFLGLSLRDGEVVTGNSDLREQFERMRLTPEAVRILALILVGIAVHNTLVNLILIEEWKTLPVLAHIEHRREIARSLTGVVLPQNVARPFSVPFFSVVADHLVNPAVVAYLALLFCPKRSEGSGPRVGFASVPGWVHPVFAVIVLDAAIVHRRNPLLVGIGTVILVLFLLRKLSRRTLITGAVVLVAGAVAFGQWRRGSGDLRAAQELDLPAVAGNTMVYEPLVYVGSGVPNFHHYWAEGHPPTGGDLHLSSLSPRPVDRALGLDVNRGVMLRRMFGDGYVIPGQTFRTPWFEAFFDFGWAGVYILAVLFPTGVHWLYRRTIVGPGRGTASLAIFTLAKVIYLFPFINVLFQLPFWTTAAAAVVIDWQLVRSAHPGDAKSPSLTTAP